MSTLDAVRCCIGCRSQVRKVAVYKNWVINCSMTIKSSYIAVILFMQIEHHNLALHSLRHPFSRKFLNFVPVLIPMQLIDLIQQDEAFELPFHFVTQQLLTKELVFGNPLSDEQIMSITSLVIAFRLCFNIFFTTSNSCGMDLQYECTSYLAAQIEMLTK